MMFLSSRSDSTMQLVALILASSARWSIYTQCTRSSLCTRWHHLACSVAAVLSLTMDHPVIPLEPNRELRCGSQYQLSELSSILP